MLAARSGNAREKCPSGAIRWPRGRRAPAPRAAPRALGAGADGAAPPPKIAFQPIFSLQCQKHGPTFKKSAAKFRASERRAERRERMQALGRHLLLELFDCDAEALNSLETVKTSMVEAAKRAQATIVDVVFHEFNPFGISGVVVIAESHLAIHTWPEYRYAAVDVFSCGDVLQPQTAADYLVEQLGASRAPQAGRGAAARPSGHHRRMSGPPQYKWFFESTTPVEGHMHAIARTISTRQT